MDQKINNLAFEFSKLTKTPKSGFYKKIKSKIAISKDSEQGSQISEEQFINSWNAKLKNLYLQYRHVLGECDKKLLSFLIGLRNKIRQNKDSHGGPSSGGFDEVVECLVKSKSGSHGNGVKSCKDENEGFSARNGQNPAFSVDLPGKNKVKSDDIDMINILQKNIKMGALGMQTNLFDEYGVYLLSSALDPQIYEIVVQVHHHAQLYRKLRETQSFITKTQLEFYEIVRHQLDLYEKEVLKSDEKILNFHISMQRAYRNLEIVNHLFDSFFTHPKNPFEFLRIYKNSLYFLELQFVDQVVVAAARQINRLLNEWVHHGMFVDPGKEFFIVKNGDNDLWNSYGIDYGLVPYFLSHDAAEKILYIGKCRVLLREVKQFKNEDEKIFLTLEDYRYKISIESNENAYFLDILDPNLPDYLDIIYKDVNSQIEDEILIKHDIYAYLEFTKDIFLGFRADFIEILLIFMSDMTKGAYFNKRSMSYVLDSALITTFGDNKFIKNIDICIFDDHYDYISLFCHLNFPLNLIVTKEIILKFVAIFKFIYKLKRLETILSVNLKMKKIAAFRNVVLKICFYVFEEVIHDAWKYEFSNIDQFRKVINLNLENILKRIFQAPNTGKEQIDCFMAALEKYAMGESSISLNFVEQQLQNFLNINRETLRETCLADLLVTNISSDKNF